MVAGPFASIFYTPFNKIGEDGQKPFIALVFKGASTSYRRWLSVSGVGAPAAAAVRVIDGSRPS